jgi:hypothetical protein
MAGHLLSNFFGFVKQASRRRRRSCAAVLCELRSQSWLEV